MIQSFITGHPAKTKGVLRAQLLLIHLQFVSKIQEKISSEGLEGLLRPELLARFARCLLLVSLSDSGKTSLKYQRYSLWDMVNLVL